MRSLRNQTKLIIVFISFGLLLVFTPLEAKLRLDPSIPPHPPAVTPCPPPRPRPPIVSWENGRPTLLKQRAVIFKPCQLVNQFEETIKTSTQSEMIENLTALLSDEILTTYQHQEVARALQEGLELYGEIDSIKPISEVNQPNNEWAEQTVLVSTTKGFEQLYRIVMRYENEEWKLFGTIEVSEQ